MPNTRAVQSERPIVRWRLSGGSELHARSGWMPLRHAELRGRSLSDLRGPLPSGSELCRKLGQRRLRVRSSTRSLQPESGAAVRRSLSCGAELHEGCGGAVRVYAATTAV